LRDPAGLLRRRDRRVDRVSVGRRRGDSAERGARVAFRGVGSPHPALRAGLSHRERRMARGIFVGVVLAIAVSALVVAWGDAPSVLATLGRFPPLLIVPVVLLTVWNYTLRWLRWNYYLRVLSVYGVSKVESALVFFSGFAMGLTPGKSGEVTKSYWLREIVGPDRAPLARTAPIVFAERLVDGIAMLLLATSGLISFRFGALALLAVAAFAAVAVGL